MRRSIGTLALVTVVGSASVAAPSERVGSAGQGRRASGADARICYVVSPDDPLRQPVSLYTVRPDGSDAREEYTRAGITQCDLSPDGRYLIFHVVDAADTYADVWRLDRETGAIVELTRSRSEDEEARWSPRGDRIAFLSSRSGARRVWFMNPDGSGQVARAGGGSGVDQAGGWSPDGSAYVFTNEGDVLAARPDGTGTNRLAATGQGCLWASFSPAGDRVLFGCYDAGSRSRRLFVVGADGGGLRTLAEHDLLYPQWADSGRSVVALAPGDGLYAMNADGGGLRRLPIDSRSRSWAASPGSAEIVYFSDAARAVLVADLAGGSPRRVGDLRFGAGYTWDLEHNVVWHGTAAASVAGLDRDPPAGATGVGQVVALDDSNSAMILGAPNRLLFVAYGDHGPEQARDFEIMNRAYRGGVQFAMLPSLERAPATAADLARRLGIAEAVARPPGIRLVSSALSTTGFRPGLPRQSALDFGVAILNGGMGVVTVPTSIDISGIVNVVTQLTVDTQVGVAAWTNVTGIQSLPPGTPLPEPEIFVRVEPSNRHIEFGQWLPGACLPTTTEPIALDTNGRSILAANRQVRNFCGGRTPTGGGWTLDSWIITANDPTVVDSLMLRCGGAVESESGCEVVSPVGVEPLPYVIDFQQESCMVQLHTAFQVDPQTQCPVLGFLMQATRARPIE